MSAILSACGTKDEASDTGASDTETDTDTDADTDTDTDTDTDPQSDLTDHTYEFESRFETGRSSVDFTGQVLRQVLIIEQKAYLSTLTDELNAGYFPDAGEINTNLDFYFSFDSEAFGGTALQFTTDPAPSQTTFDEISTGKDLVAKIAGNDETGQHKNWTTGFVGWDHADVSTPESLVRHWFSMIDDQSQSWIAGDYPLGPDGSPVPAVYVTAEGQDLQQLLQKFLTGAVTFSQGTDDYLDDDIAGKGLNSPHGEPDEEGKPFSALEHAWDEGFGYFGAARSYDMMSDSAIDGIGYQDIDGDGQIDLSAEVCFAASVNAAKRDLGAAATATTDYTAEAFNGFLAGRALIANVNGEPSADELSALQAHRDQAITAWETAVAATVVHYINDVLQDMNDFGAEEYSFADHAKHWSECKGFALWFQFNPRSRVSDSAFVALHQAIGMAPVLQSADESDIENYRTALLSARDLLGEAFSFDADNMGDIHGENGW